MSGNVLCTCTTSGRQAATCAPSACVVVRDQSVWRRQAGAAHRRDFVVVPAEEAHLVAVIGQQIAFGLHDGVFATALLVGVVDDQEPHEYSHLSGQRAT